MAIAGVTETGAPRHLAGASAPSPSSGVRPPRDLQRTFRLVLATLWLLDAVLQLQPFMFTRGAHGVRGMPYRLAAGNPAWIARTITWNSSNIYHQPILTNSIFAGVQFLIAFGIVYRRTVKPALVISIVWSLGVWWFGEGLGGMFVGGATTFGGGPGAVLFYAVLAVLLWPSEGPDLPFVAARSVGARAASVTWAAVWALLATLALVGSGRSPRALHDLVATTDRGQPGWLAHIDKSSASLFLHRGTTMAVLLAAACVVVAVGVFLPPKAAQATVVLAIVVFGLIWVAVQNFGGILAGGATDPNSGPLVIVLALIYWPQTTMRLTAAGSPGRPLVAERGP